MQHDVALREAARAIYESVYPGEEWTSVPFDVAERFGTVHYRNAVDAAFRANACLNGDATHQLLLI
ncbi:hypothetical protein [Novosphingobium sp. LASN5T]|uniref:hypothetical protein n=1 Tax=Novosphingobium sp. LASN5T TaxID=2491021 RepID=UPI000F5DEDD2|nr:hypothetical protein [Novosphingobium sp. LASN5T]RQW42268.1 hypothetical protein EH199_18635 [Novosphingobium sp. LASN5T]